MITKLFNIIFNKMSKEKIKINIIHSSFDKKQNELNNRFLLTNKPKSCQNITVMLKSKRNFYYPLKPRENIEKFYRLN